MIKISIYLLIFLLSLTIIYPIDYMYSTENYFEAKGGQVSNLNINLNIQSTKWEIFSGKSSANYIIVSFSQNFNILNLEGVKELEEIDQIYKNTKLKNDLPSNIFKTEGEIFNEYTRITLVQGAKQGILKQFDEKGVNSYVLVSEVVNSTYSLIIPKNYENLNFYEVY